MYTHNNCTLNNIRNFFLASLKFDDSVFDASSDVRNDTTVTNWYDRMKLFRVFLRESSCLLPA